MGLNGQSARPVSLSSAKTRLVTLCRPCCRLQEGCGSNREFAEGIHQDVAWKYKERLGCLDLFSLEHRRQRDGHTEVYKIMRGIDGAESEFFPRVV